MKIKLGENQPMPKYHTEGSAAFDLVATKTCQLISSVEMMDLEIAIELPEGFYAELVVRSSMSKRGVALANAVGIIDNDYRGNIHAPLVSHAMGGSLVKKGERIVQLIVKPLVQVSLELSSELSDTARGSGGFGSTNK